MLEAQRLTKCYASLPAVSNVNFASAPEKFWATWDPMVPAKAQR